MLTWLPNYAPSLALTLLLSHCPVSAADAPPVPYPLVPPNGTEPAAKLDATTVKKAEDAADAYLKQAAVRPDPLAEIALAEIEVLLLEIHALVEAKQPLKAGERYLSALEKRKAIGKDQRTILGKRLEKADHELLTLTRELLGQPEYDLGDPAAGKPVTPVSSHPAK